MWITRMEFETLNCSEIGGNTRFVVVLSGWHYQRNAAMKLVLGYYMACPR